MFLAELNNRKVELKKATTVDKSQPLLKDTKDIKEYYDVIKTGHVDTWFSLIREHTMDTEFIPLTPSDAEQLLELHKRFKRNETDLPDVKQLEQLFPDLFKNITHVLGTCFSSSGRAFVKLSSRSPKDVSTGNFDELVQHELSQLTDEEAKDNHFRCCAFVRASCKMLRVSSFEEIMSLLIRSERVHEDLQQEFEVKKPDEFAISLILREWVDIDFDLEFRGFVHNNNFTALSQYNYVCYVDPIKKNKDLIQKRIEQLFQIIQPKLQSIGTYVVDFTVNRHLLDQEDKLQECVLVVEINPYEISTGSCLFDWKTETELLKNGPFEFRIVESKDGIDLMKNVSSVYHKYLL